MEILECDVCGRSFIFGVGIGGPENCEVDNNTVKIWCPRCRTEYVAECNGFGIGIIHRVSTTVKELESKIFDVSTTAHIVPKEKWDDTLPELLNEEGIENHWEGNILSIDNGKASLAYVDVLSTRWQVGHNWIPLFRLKKYNECLEEAGKNSYYAIPENDNRSSKTLLRYERSARVKFKKQDFKTNTFEGF